MSDSRMSDNRSAARRVAMENLKPGMILARDLISEDGDVVLTSNTVLNKENFNTIMLHSQQHIYVLESSLYNDRLSFLQLERSASEHIIPVDVPILERESYQAFASAYEEMPSLLDSEYKRINSGERANPELLLRRMDNVLNTMKSRSDIMVYIKNVERGESYLHYHSLNVALLANLFGIWINASQKEIDNLTLAGLLHDIGMTQIPPEIVNKRGSVTKEEREILKKHTTLGYRILDKTDLPNEIKLAALAHHERMNGQGYPLGLKGDKISKFGRILHICDVYEAMTADRVYRERICPFDAIKSFERGSFGVFDTEALLMFLQNIAYTYLNSRVQLTDEKFGHVVFINKHALSSPIIKTEEGQIIDLSINKDLKVLCLAP